MSLADEIAAEATPNRSCVICDLLEQLDPTDADDLRAALGSEVATAAIHRALAARGHTFSRSTWTKHRADCQ